MRLLLDCRTSAPWEILPNHSTVKSLRCGASRVIPSNVWISQMFLAQRRVETGQDKSFPDFTRRCRHHEQVTSGFLLCDPSTNSACYCMTEDKPAPMSPLIFSLSAFAFAVSMKSANVPSRSAWESRRADARPPIVGLTSSGRTPWVREVTFAIDDRGLRHQYR
jgi:hypothetical protein